MDNDLEKFSEERLMDMQKHVTAGMTLGHADALLIRQAICIALAAKQTKPVALVVIDKHTDEVMLDISDEGRDLQAGDALYTTPQPAHTEQDGYWYEVECYKYKGPAKLCAGNDGPAWFFPGSDLLVDNDEVKVIGRAAAPKPESE